MQKILTILTLVIFLVLGEKKISPAIAGFSSLTLPWIKYQGGNDNPRPEALRSLLAQVTRRTSIEVNREPIELNISDPASDILSSTWGGIRNLILFQKTI